MSVVHNYNAEAAVGKYLLVKYGTVDYNVLPAAAAGDDIIGVSKEVDAAVGQPVDVQHDGIAFVLLGGTVARGKFVTSDANGKGVQAAPAAGTNNGVLGRAIESGVSGDVIRVLVDPGQIQG